MPSRRHYTLTASCPDQVGIIARVAGFIAQHGGWILESSYHADQGDEESGAAARYFMRMEVKAESLPFHLAEFRERFRLLADDLSMTWQISDSAVKRRVVILVSKQEHCLYDLLARWQSRELDIEIPCIIANHDTFKSFVEWHGIPFYHVPVDPANKAAAFAEVCRLYDEVGGDTMVLARYMQILPADFCARYPGEIINIHHSFLPSFIGARPYHQAYRRGVKLIGATCHYVTADLDEGPIIEQDVERVDHALSAEDFTAVGRDIECVVLARAVRWHIEHRVLRNGRKCVVFR
jgi:formyltetrahydrofolate deformylase